LLEEEKTSLTNKLGDSQLAFTELEKISARLTAITQELEEKEFRWLELSEIAP